MYPTFQWMGCFRIARLIADISSAICGRFGNAVTERY